MSSLMRRLRTTGRAAWITVALVVATAGVTTSAVAAVGPATPGPPSSIAARPAASSGLIRPGARLFVTGGYRCAANFVLTDGVHRYLGTASHCFRQDNSEEASECKHASHHLPESVGIQLTDGGRTTGTVVYTSSTAMRRAGVTDENMCMDNDFALIVLSDRDMKRTDPSVPVFGGPTGIRPRSEALGRDEVVHSFQRGVLRTGIRCSADTFASHHVAGMHSIQGDSGSPVLDPAGRAVGIVAAANDSVTDISNLEYVLNYANTVGGFRGALRLVGGSAVRTSPVAPPTAQVQEC